MEGKQSAQKSKPRPQKDMDPGSSKRIRSVGLIQVQLNLDLTVERELRANQN
jgi:hypothetical protein